MKPPLILDPPNRTPYTCLICKKPDLGTPNQRVHDGACRREWKRQRDAAKAEKRRSDRARVMSGRTVL